MILKVLLSVLLFTGCCYSQLPPPNRTYVEIAFQNIRIVPDILDSAPRQSMLIQYTTGETIDLGESVSPLDTRTVPTIYWSVASASEYYTLLMVDPDAPSRLLPILRENLHWLVINIRGSDVTTGQTIAEYMAPSPGFGTGLHRYVFLAFKQPGKFDLLRFKMIAKGDLFNRVKFNTRSFTRTQNLSRPIAGKYFEADFDKKLFPFFDRLFE